MKTYKISIFILIFFCFVGIFGPFIAGDRAIFCHSPSRMTMPVLSYYGLKIQTPSNDDNCIMPFIPFSPQNMDSSAQGAKSPFDANIDPNTKKHWLGTDNLGRDIASGMIHGTSNAMMISIFAVLISFLVGIFLGMTAGYFGDSLLKVNSIQFILTVFMFLFVLFYSTYEYLVFHKDIIAYLLVLSISICVIYYLNYFFLSRLKLKKFSLPLDTLFLKLITIRKSLPTLFIILIMISLFSSPSIWNVVLIISLLGWIEFARIARSETLAIKEENFVLSAKMIGFSHFAILSRQILPNVMPTLWIAICFSVTSAILLESALSFLGIGLPPESVSWGQMMSEGRKINAWWMVVFPGFTIFLIIMALNNIVSYLQEQKKI